MGEKSSRRSLPDLPTSKSEFWEYAEVNLINLDTSEKGCEHYLEVIQGNQAKCSKCGAGYFIGVDDVVKDGHLFHSNKLVI